MEILLLAASSPAEGETLHQDWLGLAVQGLLAVKTSGCEPPASVKERTDWSMTSSVSFSQDKRVNTYARVKTNESRFLIIAEYQ